MKDAKKIDYLIASIMNGRDKFIQIFESATEKAEKEREKAKHSFIGDRLKEELARIDTEKDATIQSARAEVFEAVSARAADLRNTELEAVTMGASSFNSLVELEKISSLPVSALEFNALCNRWGGSGSGYWARKALNQIAQKNGLPYAAELSIDEKMSIVGEIVSGFSDYLQIYNGKGKTDLTSDEAARAFASVSNEVLTRAASRYQAGDTFGSLSDERAAVACYESIKACDDYNGGLRLRNFLQNANDNSKNKLLLLLIGDSSINDKCLALAGINGNELRANYAERVSDYENQIEQLASLKRSQDAGEMQRALANDKNGFLRALIQSEARSNEGLCVLAEECGIELPGEGE